MRITTEGTVEAPGSPRLNLIFHGLMAFRDAGAQHYDVLIPRTPDGGGHTHVAKYGNPRYLPHVPLMDFPSDLRRSYFTIEGVRDGAATVALPSSTNAVILRNGVLAPRSENILAIVRVPKPDVIRHYRGAEARGIGVATNAETQQAIFRPPDLIHEVTVFSYFFFYNPRLVGPDINYPIPNVGANYYNLCIYSQPVDQCQADDNKLFNNMFRFRNSASSVGVNLFLQTLIADGYPVNTSIGIASIELKALRELYVQNDALPALTGDPGGCGGAFVCDGDGPNP
jgi:hypothetical protein